MADAAAKPKKKRHEDADGGQLTWRQQEFLRHFATGITATEAARRAGYAERSARSTTFDLLRHPVIKRELEAIRAKLREQLLWEAADAFEEMGRVMDAAEANGQYNAAVNASLHRARICGLIQDKQKIDVTMTTVDLGAALAEARARVTRIEPVSPSLRPMCDPAQIEDAQFTVESVICDARPTDKESVSALPAPPSPRSPDMDS